MVVGSVVRLLGAVTVEVDGKRTSAGGPRQAAVLSVLALNIGRPVSVERLIDSVWGEEPPNSVTNVLQVYVSALRKLIRGGALGIVRAGSTYTLTGSLDHVDVEMFHRLAAEGRSSLRAADVERALAALDHAWELWNPVPFAGLDECAFVGSARASLLSSALAVATDRGLALCAVGRAAEAASLSQQLVEDHPFHEPAWELLMSALYHSGRQHDALLAFSRARAQFVEELGLDPPAALVELERQILDRTLQPIASRPESLMAGAAAGAAPSRLPDPPSGMIGRAAEIERILQLVEQGVRLVTLVGLGGIGKTTTALAVGHRLSAAGRAVVMADLSGALEPAAALGLMCEAASVGVGSDPATSLVAADPDLVLIADNVEQIVDFANAAARLLSSTSRLSLIVTSRRALRIRAEHVIPIHPLDISPGSGLGDAALLFIERADQHGNHLDPSRDRSAIVEICELAGGIPLAIEVVASRLGRLTPLTLLDRLRRHHSALLDDHGAVDLPDRQHSLRTVLDATSTLLAEPATALARRLCVLKGPISMGLIEQAFLDDTEPVDSLGELVEASLVNGPDPAGRYRMPIPVAEFFADGRDGHHDVDAAVDGQRLLRAVLSTAEALAGTVDTRGLWGEIGLLGDAAAVTVACDAVLTNGDVRTGTLLAMALRRYWLLSSRFGEALKFCAGVIELGAAGDERARLQLLVGQFAAMVNRPDAGELLADGIQLSTASGGVEPHLLVNSMCYLGSWMCDHGDLDGARDVAARVDAMARASADHSVIELSRDFGSYAAERSGDFDTAARLSTESLVDVRRAGDRYVMVDVLYRTAENLLQLGRVDEAESMMEEAMQIAQTTPIGPLAARVIAVRAVVDLEQGRLSAAIGGGLEALRLTVTIWPDPVAQAGVLRILGAAWSAAGDVEAAARCDGVATATLQRAGAADEAASLGPIDRRLEAVRNDPHARSLARLAALDPEALVERLLAGSGA